MFCPTAANDNGDRRSQGAAGPAQVQAPRLPDRLEAEVARLQTEAERASLDALAYILAIAAREANRVAEWERRVRAELGRSPGGRRPFAAP